jgi:integrase
MPALKLTSTSIQKLPIPAFGQVLYRDTERKGLAVRVTPSGKKCFVIDKWDKEKGRVARVVISDVNELTVYQARIQADKLIGQVVRGSNPVEERRRRKVRGVTLREVHAAYMKARKNLAASTTRDYHRLVNVYVPDWLDRPMATITKDDIEERHAAIGKRSGPAQANYLARLLRALFYFANEKYSTDGEPFIPVNPVKRLSSARAWFRVDRRQSYIKPTQLKAWFQALEQERGQARDFFQVLILTGLRRSEASRLAWKNVDLAHKTLTVPDPKNKQPHTLPLSDYLLRILERRSKASNGSQWVFPAESRSGHLEDCNQAVARIVEASGVTFTPHDLRRTFLSIAESLDLSAYAVKRLANHKMRSDVTAGYIVSDIERLRKPMQRVTDFVLKAAGVKKSAEVVKLKRSSTAA